MTRESRLVFLAGLTLTIYAAWGYFQHGDIVFPFPINDFIFLLIAGQFFIWHRKKGLPIYLMLFAGIFGLLSNKVFWEIVMSIETLENFLRYPWVIWFMFFNALCLLIAAIQIIIKQRSHYTSLIATVGAITFGAGFHMQKQALTFIGIGLILLSVLIRPINKPIHLLWVLLFVLELTEFLTYFLA